MKSFIRRRHFFIGKWRFLARQATVGRLEFGSGTVAMRYERR